LVIILGSLIVDITTEIVITSRFVFVALMSVAYARNLPVFEGYDCTASYLKRNGMLEKGIPVVFNDLPAEECSEKLENFKNAFYTEIKNGFDSNEDLARNSQCMVDQLKKLRVAELTMKEHIYGTLSGLTKRKQKEILKKIESSIDSKMKVAAFLCVFKESFGEMFDELIVQNSKSHSGEKNVSESSLKEDYCVRKHFVDNNLIDTTLFPVILNPKSITVNDSDCSDILKTFIIETEDELVDQFADEDGKKLKRRCIAKTVKTSRYFEVMGKVFLLTELQITPEVKDRERALFIEAMKVIVEEIMKC